ncbi:hypothetical protein FGO68_gene12290 [Halteria grandinella]|uniref:TLDc domain-containing protein n=1 Tax=Halteria grandinella TaxID=5974 RepID=A0A8J8NUD8_HALGN|nr:hypothetical protein FGO68_gene12290 [Halteria grandinella]
MIQKCPTYCTKAKRMKKQRRGRQQMLMKKQLEKKTQVRGRLGRIKSKYLIIQILCWSDNLEECTRIFSKSCRVFNKLYSEELKSFLFYGQSWEQKAIPQDGQLIQTQRDIRLISKGLKGMRFKLEKIFDINTDRDHPDIFHEKCDGIPHTICVLKTECERIFGGYTEAPWEVSEEGQYKSDPNAFLFSLTKHSLHPVKPDKAMYATYHNKLCFCVFGEVYRTDDLYVGGWAKESLIGKTYMWKDGPQIDQDKSSQILKEEEEVGIQLYAEDDPPYLAKGRVFEKTAFEAYKVLFY